MNAKGVIVPGGLGLCSLTLAHQGGASAVSQQEALRVLSSIHRETTVVLTVLILSPRPGKHFVPGSVGIDSDHGDLGGKMAAVDVIVLNLVLIPFS